MLKKLFQKRQSILEGRSDRVDVILRLMFEIAISDGNLDKAELAILKKRASQISTLGEKSSDIIKKVISVSFYLRISVRCNDYTRIITCGISKLIWNV
jgi:hypothetical protein